MTLRSVSSYNRPPLIRRQCHVCGAGCPANFSAEAHWEPANFNVPRTVPQTLTASQSPWRSMQISSHCRPSVPIAEARPACSKTSGPDSFVPCRRPAQPDIHRTTHSRRQVCRSSTECRTLYEVPYSQPDNPKRAGSNKGTHSPPLPR
ncbi:hypothetical protein L226DRAFT_122072 [Lentinus tigrinus ALCF2SS1-7]|uniref:uncharacterized protein n=1 Tax=Lentinus tigrinus ALCF2SS1-7 TaxID=1328758 RepID=UPI001166216F|nr:hypothetical protein L226DRAFT_122072 [Lentinus tigrinus ALCF2SS1-7]